MSETPLIRLRGITKTYGEGNTAFQALKGVDLDIQQGEFVAIMGPSGSGKSTAMNTLGCLDVPTTGTYEFQGVQVQSLSRDERARLRRRYLGFVFQGFNLLARTSAQENVELPLIYRGEPAAKRHAAAARALEQVGLKGWEHHTPGELSGGQQQRVALARALAPKPELLLLDEPFSAVDAPTRQTLYRELAALRQQVSVPMVLVTHDLAEARRLADRVVIVDAGQTLQTGQPSRVFASPRNARVAELVGIQNHFEGRFYKDTPGWARLRWTPAGHGHEAIDLTVVDKNKIDDGTPVTWVLNGEQVDVLADASTPGPGDARATRLRCRLVEVLALGEISLCTLTPEALPAQCITLNLTTRLLDRLQVDAGGWVQLLIAPGALHIMPVRETSA